MSICIQRKRNEQENEELFAYGQETFDSIRHFTDDGTEFWYCRGLQKVLGYARWRRFSEAIDRAKESCRNSGNEVENHFADVGKMVPIGSGAELEVEDVMITRYACYLIVMNGDPRKEIIAIVQTYFAVKTRQQELVEDYDRLSEEQKRLAIRHEMIEHNRSLAEAKQDPFQRREESPKNDSGAGWYHAKGFATP